MAGEPKRTGTGPSRAGVGAAFRGTRLHGGRVVTVILRKARGGGDYGSLTTISVTGQSVSVLFPACRAQCLLMPPLVLLPPSSAPISYCGKGGGYCPAPHQQASALCARAGWLGWLVYIGLFLTCSYL